MPAMMFCKSMKNNKRRLRFNCIMIHQTIEDLHLDIRFLDKRSLKSERIAFELPELSVSFTENRVKIIFLAFKLLIRIFVCELISW